MVLLRDKLITQGERRETSTKTCSETMLRNKLKVFVSRISPPFSYAVFQSTLLVESVKLGLWSGYSLEAIETELQVGNFERKYLFFTL